MYVCILIHNDYHVLDLNFLAWFAGPVPDGLPDFGMALVSTFDEKSFMRVAGQLLLQHQTSTAVVVRQLGEWCVLWWANMQVGWLANEQQLDEQELRAWVHQGGYGRLVSPSLSLTRNHRWIANLDSHKTAMPLSATASLKSYSAPRCFGGIVDSWAFEALVASCKSFRTCVTF